VLLIRTAQAGDLDAILAIEQAAFRTDRLSRRALRHHLARGGLNVADLDGEVAGYFVLLRRAGATRSRLYSIAVAPGRAGNGIGRRLLEAAEARAAAGGSLELRLEVRTDNVPAIALYERSGYRRLGTIEDFYADGAPALRLGKPLSASSHPGRAQG
jgi:ribosomal-protein-alanine N-acetyltransferase